MNSYVANDNAWLEKNRDKMIISINKAYFSHLPAYISPLIMSSTYIG